MDNAIFDYRLPSPPLREYVRLLQVVGCAFPASLPVLPVKAYWPRAEQCLSFFPKDPEQVEYGFDGQKRLSTRSRLYGQHTVVTNRHVGRDFMVFQVQFQPGALHRLTGLPAYELTNTYLDAEAVFGADISRVNERLSYCRHYTEMIAVVETYLTALVSRARQRTQRPIDRASQYLLHHPGTTPLDWLADQACLSPRQFYRQFVDREGISPKLFARVARFEQAMKLKNAQPQKDWLSVALDLGYYDYQHLVRDFNTFTGLTPNQFLAQENRSPERTFGKVET
jgi:AraC-like DNA-binding protein